MILTGGWMEKVDSFLSDSDGPGSQAERDETSVRQQAISSETFVHTSTPILSSGILISAVLIF